MQAFLEGDADLEARECSSCRQRVAASKKLQLYMLPEVLVLSLKRFQQTQEGTKKLATMVEFPVQGWDLSDYVQHPQVIATNLSFVLHHCFSNAQCCSFFGHKHMPLIFVQSDALIYPILFLPSSLAYSLNHQLTNPPTHPPANSPGHPLTRSLPEGHAYLSDTTGFTQCMLWPVR